jgi:iron complex transport system substrate-binding protein
VNLSNNASARIVTLSLRINSIQKLRVIFMLLAFAGALFFSCSRNEQRSSSEETNQPIRKYEGIPDRFLPVLEQFENRIPERVISISPSATELLFEYGAGDRIVGATEPHDYPPEAGNIESIGNTAVDLERVVILKPDIVIGEADLYLGMNLQDSKVPILLFDTRTIDDLVTDIRLLEILFKNNQADRLISQLKASTEFQAEYNPRVAIMVSSVPMILAADDSWFSNLVKAAGGENVVSGRKGDYIAISVEDLIRFDPEVILYTWEDTRIDLMKDSRLTGITAIKKNRIIYVDPDLMLRPTVRSIRDGVPLLISCFSEGR